MTRTIKAIFQDGAIRPIEPVPPEWDDGQELKIEAAGETTDLASRIDEWDRKIEEGVNAIPQEEHDRFMAALDDIEKESKEAVRREWNLP